MAKSNRALSVGPVLRLLHDRFTRHPGRSKAGRERPMNCIGTEIARWIELVIAALNVKARPEDEQSSHSRNGPPA